MITRSEICYHSLRIRRTCFKIIPNVSYEGQAKKYYSASVNTRLASVNQENCQLFSVACIRTLPDLIFIQFRHLTQSKHSH